MGAIWTLHSWDDVQNRICIAASLSPQSFVHTLLRSPTLLCAFAVLSKFLGMIGPSSTVTQADGSLALAFHLPLRTHTRGRRHNGR